jgi:adenylate kinase
MKLILIGIQGAGKSTQGNILSKELDIPYLSTGHIFRIMAKEKTKIGRYLKEVMVSGALVPDHTTMEIVSEYLKRPEYEKGYIMDGFPRTTKQAEQFENGIDKVIYLRVSDREALWRLSYRQEEREDETLAAIRKRIELFHKVTEPVIEWYRHKHQLLEIDGEQSIEEISKEILHKLKNIPHE